MPWPRLLPLTRVVGSQSRSVDHGTGSATIAESERMCLILGGSLFFFIAAWALSQLSQVGRPPYDTQAHSIYTSLGYLYCYASS